MSTVLEIEKAIEALALPEKREVLDFVASQIEAESGEAAFPDLKRLLEEMPEVGGDDDFARLHEAPRDPGLS